MNVSSATDPELLAAWAYHRDESAFHELVVRYAGLVQMAAHRTCGDVSLAADASQLVFTQLAQNSRSLLGHPSLAGWLHVTASMKAKSLVDKTLREERKRRLFESAMDPQSSAPPENSWEEIQPYLTDAVNALSEKDREAILLRFYRSMSVKEIAATLGLTANTAQKRLDRATERLREKLNRRGVTTAGSLSAVMLAGYASEAKAATISTTILSSKAIAASASGSLFAPLLTTMTTTKAAACAIPIIALLMGGSYLYSQSRAISQESTNSEKGRPSEPVEISEAHSSTAANTAAIRTLPSEGAVPRKQQPHLKLDMNAVLEEFIATKSSFFAKYDPIFREMPSQQLGIAIQEISAVKKSKEAIFLTYHMTLALLENDFPYGFEHFESQVETLSKFNKFNLTASFAGWARKDYKTAAAWLDEQVTVGKFDTKRLDGVNPIQAAFENTLFQGLLTIDPAAAAARLEHMPPEIRTVAFPEGFQVLKELTHEQYVQMDELIHNYLPRN